LKQIFKVSVCYYFYSSMS